MFYSKTTNGFYDSPTGDHVPSDVVEISDEYWISLRQGQSEGKYLTSDADGYPILVDQPAPSDEWRAQSVRQRRDIKLELIYDKGVQMALRERRSAQDPASIAYLDAKIVELDAYAKALCEVPDQPGFPHQITWPTDPEA